MLTCANITTNCNKEEDFLFREYDIVVWKNRLDYSEKMHPGSFTMTRTKTFKKLELININGLGMGQAHFKNREGAMVILPWCAIISMIPSEIEMEGMVSAQC